MKELQRKISIGKLAAVILLLLLGVFASPASRVSAADNYALKVPLGQGKIKSLKSPGSKKLQIA